MKSVRITFLILTFILLGLSGAARAHTSVSLSLDFHDALRPYGSWVHVSGCSDCWRPSTPGFVPYTNGQWVYTSYGPTWQGEESWAWAPYHYGRWTYSAQYGWLWVPGYEWSPARVSWAYGNDYIGWSPVYGAGLDSNLWVVVHRDNFRNRNYSSVRIQRDNVRSLFARRAVRINRGPLQRTVVERIVRRSIPVTRVRERVIEVNHHRTRLVVPEERERAVVEHITRISHKPVTTPAVQHRTISNNQHVEKQKVHVTEKHKVTAPTVQHRSTVSSNQHVEKQKVHSSDHHVTEVKKSTEKHKPATAPTVQHRSTVSSNQHVEKQKVHSSDHHVNVTEVKKSTEKHKPVVVKKKITVKKSTNHKPSKPHHR